MQDRATAAQDIARSAGGLALDYFHRMPSLTVEAKGPQDFVTEADRSVETHIRARIEEAFPLDGILGEEHAPKPSETGVTWVIDPIDGTANFISSIPQWCVVLAIVAEDQTQVGVIYDAVHDELFSAVRGQGGTLNGKNLVCPADGSLTSGAVGVGFSNRTEAQATLAVIGELTAAGGRFFRNASGALSLAYVSAGRLQGYVEQHMHPWDCMAGQLLIAEAGGQVEAQSADAMLAKGGRVIAGGASVFADLRRIADESFGPLEVRASH